MAFNLTYRGRYIVAEKRYVVKPRTADINENVLSEQCRNDFGLTEEQVKRGELLETVLEQSENYKKPGHRLMIASPRRRHLGGVAIVAVLWGERLSGWGVGLRAWDSRSLDNDGVVSKGVHLFYRREWQITPRPRSQLLQGRLGNTRAEPRVRRRNNASRLGNQPVPHGAR
ncbi:unnamed protein product [Notodromas monacha]|uniref:Uncharacterized protein n=1 Tax=Notodromas monacha TaxID=399045 RepID=A0A7R9G8V6_9CRUS|nr:unnamed protein product [Notodromas monacha]CAG0912498.1 unnamed protein product [Notodromas monacha]